MSIKTHVPFLLSLITICRLLLGRFGKLPLLKSIIWLPYLHDLFVLILVNSHTTVSYLILPTSPCICYSVVEYAFYRVYFSLVSLGDVDVMWSIYYYYYYYTFVVFAT